MVDTTPEYFDLHVAIARALDLSASHSAFWLSMRDVKGTGASVRYVLSGENRGAGA